MVEGSTELGHPGRLLSAGPWMGTDHALLITQAGRGRASYLSGGGLRIARALAQVTYLQRFGHMLLGVYVAMWWYNWLDLGVSGPHCDPRGGWMAFGEAQAQIVHQPRSRNI